MSRVSTEGGRLWHVARADAVNVVSVDPSATLILVGDLAGHAVLLDAEDGRSRAELADHPLGVLAAAWSPDGRIVAVGGADGSVHGYDRHGQRLWSVQRSGWTGAVAWSPDGAVAALSIGRNVTLTAADGSWVRDLGAQPSSVTDLVWAGGRSAGRQPMLGVACYGGVRWFDVLNDEPAADTGQYTAEGGLQPTRVFAWQGSLLCLTVAPDGRWVASGNQDASVHIWRLWSASDAEMTGYPSKVTELAWDHTGRWLAVGSAPVVTLWDHRGRGPQGRRPVTLEGHTETVTALAWSPASTMLLAGAADGRLLCWPFTRTRGHTPRTVATCPARISRLAFAADEQLLIADDAGGVQAVDLAQALEDPAASTRTVR